MFIWKQNLTGHPILLFANLDKSRHIGVFVSWQSKSCILSIPGKVHRDLRNTWGQHHRLGSGLRDCRYLWALAVEEYFSCRSGYMGSWWPSQQHGPSAALATPPAAQHLFWAWDFQASSLKFGWQFFFLRSPSFPFTPLFLCLFSQYNTFQINFLTYIVLWAI